MTPDERIEKLLNRAGQTISDLPRVNGIGMPYGVDRYEPLLKEASDFMQFNAPSGFEVFNVIQYALHLTDVIDRMETALENVCGERDYLLKTQSFDCEDCVNYGPDDCPEMRTDPALWCDSTTAIWKGIPEDWSVDDELDDPADA